MINVCYQCLTLYNRRRVSEKAEVRDREKKTGYFAEFTESVHCVNTVFGTPIEEIDE